MDLGAVVSNKQQRILGFLNTPKGRTKFAKSLSHDLVKVLDKSKISSKPSESDLSQDGYLYCSNGVSSSTCDKLSNLYGKAPWEGGWLIVSKDGNLAIYRPEGRIDDELCIKL